MYFSLQECHFNPFIFCFDSCKLWTETFLKEYYWVYKTANPYCCFASYLWTHLFECIFSKPTDWTNSKLTTFLQRLMEGVALQGGAGGGPGLLMDNGEEKTPVRIIPIPLEPVSRSSSTSEKVKGHVSPLGIKEISGIIVNSAASLSDRSVCFVLVTMETFVRQDKMDMISTLFNNLLAVAA